MAKISTYPSADVPLQLSDRLIGTEAIRPVPSPTPLATKNFSLGELLQLFSANFPAATLQAVLNAGNIATQNITLTGTINVTLIKPTNIQDILGSQGTTFQYLSKAVTGINWVDLPIDNLQAVLNSGNTATQNIILTGYIQSTLIVPKNIKDENSLIGTVGQTIKKTATGFLWSNPPAPFAPTLDEVLTNGNQSLLDAKVGSIYLHDDTKVVYSEISTDNNYFIFSNIADFSSDQFNWYGTYKSTIQTGVITQDRVYTLPDASGTIALTSDIPTTLIFTSPLVNTAGTVTINQSGLTTDGYLSSIDWNIFNNKQEALLGTGFVKSTAGVISYDTNTYYLASNPDGFITSAALTGYVPYTGATGPVNLGPYDLTVNGITVGRGSGNDTNTAVGILALPSSVTGTFNTAIGRSALTSNTSGSGNTAIGTSTLFLNTGGSNNVAVGFSSILYNSSGNNNTAIGYQSLRNNQSGSLNVASGLDALYSNTTGYNNTAFGASALFFNVSSYNNVGIGYNANTLSASNFNSIVIGADAIGAGSNTTVLGNSSITKAVIYGDLGLGTTAPSQKLHVVGNARITGAIYDSSNDAGTLGQVLSSTATGTDWVTLTDMGLTSVGLSMPVAFTVANTPLTANGTIAVSAAGLSSQYIRGDGQLATFPTSGGGGSSVNYYLNGSIPSDVAGYQQMANEAVIGGGTDFNLTGNGLIAQFLTDIGNPNRTQIPGGAWNFEMFFQVSSAGGNQKFYLELLKYDGINFNLISSSVLIPEEITGGTSIDLYLTSLAVPTTPLLTTDRLAVRVYITDNAVGRTITLHTENTSLCEIITTFSGGVTSLNGLTENTQYLAVGTSGMDFNISSVLDTHTFNLPTASSTKRGALSITDWLIFNSKISGSGTANYIPKFTAIGTTIGNSLIYDNGTNVGIGTTSPDRKLSVFSTDISSPYQMSIGYGSTYKYDIGRDDVNGYLTFYGVQYGYDGYVFSGANGEKMRITSSGNVGIGTTNPMGKLGIGNQTSLISTNGITLGGSETSIEFIGSIFGAGYGSKIYQSGERVLSIAGRGGSTTWTNNLNITDWGDVGIGTTSPGAKLDVLLGTANSDIAQFSGAVQGRGLKISTFSTGVTDAGVLLNAQTTSIAALAFATNGIEAMRINNNNNVGIGTTSPSDKLEILGDAFNLGVYRNADYNIVGAASSVISVGQLVGTTKTPAFDLIGLSESTTDGQFRLRVRSSDVMTEAMRITSNGNVGIGTTSPTAKLYIDSGTSASGFHVLSSNTTSLRTYLEATAGNVEQHFLFTGNQDWVLGLDKADSNKFKLASADDAFASAKLTVTTGGNVGIGTTSPLSLLELSKNNASGGGFLNIVNTNTAMTGKIADIIFKLTDSVGTIKNAAYIQVIPNTINIADGASMAFFTRKNDSDPTESLRINNNGNVGIGTTSPAYKLDVSGTGRFLDDLNLDTSSANTQRSLIFRDAGTVKWQVYKSTVNDFRIYRQGSANDALVIGTNDAATFSSSVSAMSLRLDNGDNLTWGGTYGAGIPTIVGYNPGVSSGSLSFFPNGSTSGEKMRIDSTGNVGIGTTNPSTKLQVEDVNKVFDGYGNINVFTTDTAAADIGGSIAFGGKNSSGNTSPYPFAKIQGIKEGSASSYNGALLFGTTANSSAVTERMRITSGGNIGIGTTSPTTGKVVIFQTGGTQLNLISGESYNTTDVVIKLTASSDYRGRGIWMENSTTSETWYAGVPYTGGSYSIGYHATQPELLANSKFFVSSNGNVGIGTTSPGAKLHVSSGNIRLNDTAQIEWGGTRNAIDASNSTNTMRFWTNDTERMRITSGGNVGIGTTAPASSAILDLTSTTQGFLPPRMTQGHRTAIVSPQLGLCVYCIDGYEGLYIFKSTGWEYVG